MKKLIQTFLFLFVATSLWAQDVIYTVSGDYNGGKTPLDSIIVDNITNGTSISFGDLPEHDYYQINLTKGAYWGAVNVFDLEESSIFQVIQNEPGLLSVRYGGTVETDAKVSVINVNGQTLYMNDDLYLHPQNSLQVKLGSGGVYFVKVESPIESNTFKAIGGAGQTGYVVELNDDINIKSVTSVTLKSTTIVGEGDFTFEDGDSIRIWAFRKDIYAWPAHKKIKDSDEVNFQFEKVEYSAEMLVAYPDSVGEVIEFTVNGDTLYYEKINGEYVHQGDIILSEEQINLDLLKGAATDDLVKLWPDGIVYYTINDNAKDNQNIKDAILYWNANTPVEFRDRKKEENYVEFISDDNSTSSSLGMTGKKQEIKVHDYSNYGDIVHEIGHTIGLIHEHSRSDRNEFLTVYDYKVKYSKRHNYKRYGRSRNNGDFDWNSIMLYESNCPESWLGLGYQNPIMVKYPSEEEFKNQNSYLSRGDLKIIEELYGKNASKRPTVKAYHKINNEDNSVSIFGKIEDEGASDVNVKGIAWKKAGEDIYHEIPVDEQYDEFNIKLSGLQEPWLYYYYAFARNSYGSSSSEIISFWYEIDESQSENFGTFTDSRDGTEYKWVKIGEQIWMAENLAFLPNDAKMKGSSYSEKRYYVQGYYGSNASEAKEEHTSYNYTGVLYNWIAARDACPEEWHLPSDDEWKKLEIAIGMAEEEVNDVEERGTDEGSKLKDKYMWSDGGSGTDDFGFNAHPGGRTLSDGSFYGFGKYGTWTTNTEYTVYPTTIFVRGLSYDTSTIYRGWASKKNGLSVRCIKD